MEDLWEDVRGWLEEFIGWPCQPAVAAAAHARITLQMWTQDLRNVSRCRSGYKLPIYPHKSRSTVTTLRLGIDIGAYAHRLFLEFSAYW